MGFGQVLTNPMVLAGGAAIGLIILVTRAPAASAAVSPAIVSGTVAMNTAALGSQVELTSINADVAKTAMSTDLAEHAYILSFLKTIDDNDTLLASQRVQSQAGITNNLITSSFALQTDIQNNVNRLALAQQETVNERIRANSAEQVARYQYKGAKAAATASIIGHSLDAVSGLAKAFI